MHSLRITTDWRQEVSGGRKWVFENRINKQVSKMVLKLLDKRVMCAKIPGSRVKSSFIRRTWPAAPPPRNQRLEWLLRIVREPKKFSIRVASDRFQPNPVGLSFRSLIGP
jgi:hypothetical protein